MSQISLYWIAVQQETTTLRPQNCCYLYVKFGAESMELGLFFLQEM